MCGIAGIVGIRGKPVHRSEVKAMCSAMLHRGPDDDGNFVEGHVGLGVQRLSVIDVKNGQQPAWNEEHDICVVTNGEIYNYRELRLELISRGHLFSTGSDTEVIVHLYEEMGEQCLQRLRGMFAFALWDKKKQLLLLARDRLGVKPLYYAETRGRLIFASELKALLQLPDIKKEINWESVSYLFSFLSTPPNASILSGIQKLEPGNYLRLEQGKPVEIKKYWDVQFSPDNNRSERETVNLLREKLQAAVRYCMVSDVPVGAFLSGGLSSSSVVAMMSRETSVPVQTFSIAGPGRGYDETAQAEKISHLFGTQHNTLTTQPDVAEKMQQLAWFLDEPFGDPSVIRTHLMSQLAQRHVKVALSGDGGDELFAGHEKYQVYDKQRDRYVMPFAVRKLAVGISNYMPEGGRSRHYLRRNALTGVERYLDAGSIYARHQKASLFAPEFAKQILSTDMMQSVLTALNDSNDSNWLSALQYNDIKRHLPLNTLTKIDRMSMASSVEVRVPLLDHTLVEFAATIPDHMKLRQGKTRHIFKETVRAILPDEFVNRPEQVRAAPLGYWFQGKLDAFLKDLLLSDRCLERGYFNRRYIEKLLARYGQDRSMEQHLWLLVCFELWCQAFMDKDLVNPSLRQDAANKVSPIRPHIRNIYPEILRSYSEGR